MINCGTRRLRQYKFNPKQLFSAPKTPRGPLKPGFTPSFSISADGLTLIIDRDGLRNRWAENFKTTEQTINRQSCCKELNPSVVCERRTGSTFLNRGSLEGRTLVSKKVIWTVVARHGCPRKCIQIIGLLHDCITGEVSSSGDHSDPFKISIEVKQGCVFALDLFILFSTCVLRQAVQDKGESV
ncbi:hypothetical protein ElyMa_002771200 [Elysia marginata]|uniref:Uncharacterized protein n=1 Tax=Elysia marginata TaxID=1093978 RepID=A0AAV4HMU7_9GAST|nr:hypothetical protein ElyMa_002771200 [Elysia marginata]